MADIGLEIKNVNNLISRGVCNLKTMSLLKEVTGSNGYILRYLKREKDQQITQKMIEQTMGITRSTASTVLSRMEKMDWIKREALVTDSRSRLVSITSKGLALCEQLEEELALFEKGLVKGFSEKELVEFVILLNKIKENLKEEKRHD